MRTIAVEAGGRMSTAAVERAVGERIDRVQQCYRRALRSNPSLSGDVSLRFTIERDGRVSSASATGDIRSPAVLACISGAFHELSVLPPEGGAFAVGYRLMLATDEP